jgi:Flp pilus assembly pilin Flp
MRVRLRRVLGDAGAAVVEYAVLLALIAVVCVGGLTVLGRRADAKLKDDRITTALSGSTTTTLDDDDETTTTTRPVTTTTTRPSATTTTRPSATTTTRPSTTTTTICRGRFC